MRRHVFTKDQEKKIKENYLKMSSRKLAEFCKCDRGVIQRYLKKNNLIVPKDIVEKFRIEAMTGRTTFTAVEDKFIKDNYLTMPVKTMAAKLNRSGCGVTRALKRLNLSIPKKIIEQRKKDSHYKKGHTPENKGKKQIDFMSPEAIERTKSTRFKKGHKPHNALAEGKEVLRKDKSGRKYVLVKAPGSRKLQLKHRVVYETHHGKIPPKHNIIFKDNNTLNTNIENLECISDSDLMSRNTLHNYPQEIKELIYLKGAINRQINKQKEN